MQVRCSKAGKLDVVRASPFLLFPLFLLLASCAGPSDETPPAPVGPGPTAIAPPSATTSARGHTVIVVKPGQSLGRVAEAYHVSKKAIIAANHLEPPYDLKIGARLIIPGGTTAVHPVPAAKAKAKIAKPAEPHHTEIAHAAKPPKRAVSGPDIIPLDDPAPPAAADRGSNPQ